MKYLVYASLQFRVEADDENAAKEVASKHFEEFEKLGEKLNAKVENARVADESSGYFLR